MSSKVYIIPLYRKTNVQDDEIFDTRRARDIMVQGKINLKRISKAIDKIDLIRTIWSPN